MTQIIPDGGNRTTEDQYTGEPNEIRVDQSNHDLRLHDGVKKGGYPIQNRDNADQRYQAKSPELSGLTGFEPQQHGFLARLGPADYRLRTLTVNTGNLTITFGDGFAGDPEIGLAPSISTDHEWFGQHEFHDVVQFDSGINADVFGDITGNVLGNVIGDVTGDTDGTHTGAQIGDVDVRGKTLSLDDDQIPQSKVAGLGEALTSLAMPIGMIMLWSGSADTIPTGWVLCDGTLSTPDLRDRFVVGATVTHAVGDNGGTATFTPRGTVADSGLHTHTLSGNTASATTGDSLNKSMQTTYAGGGTQSGIHDASISSPGHAHPIGGSADSDGNHNHVFNGTADSMLPPFYALCYIMRHD